MPDELSIRLEKNRRLTRIKWYEEEMLRRMKSVAQLLKELRDDSTKPYLATHDNFEHFCQDRWNITARRAQQLIASENVRAMLCDSTPEPKIKEVVSAMSEGQLRPLKDTPPAEAIKIIQQAMAAPKFTAKTIKQAKAKVIPPKTIDVETQSTEPPKCCPTCHRPMP